MSNLVPGLLVGDSAGHQDQALRVTVNRSGRLIPVVPGMKVAS